jgi:hypothetical protein
MEAVRKYTVDDYRFKQLLIGSINLWKKRDSLRAVVCNCNSADSM